MTGSGWASASGARALAKAGLFSLVLVVITTLGGAPFAAATPQPWSIQPSVNNGPDPNYLVATSCLSSQFCMAVGHYSDQAGDDQTLIETWNGASWELLTSPDAGARPTI